MRIFPKKRSAGFTLIELMIVVAIIGILSSIAIPRLQGFQTKSYRAEALTNMGSLQKTVEAYYGEAEYYSCNLDEIGWNPVGSPRYTYGWSPTLGAPSGGCAQTANTGMKALLGTNNGYSDELMTLNDGVTIPAVGNYFIWTLNNNTALTRSTCFVAVGNIDNDDGIDMLFAGASKTADFGATFGIHFPEASPQVYVVLDDSDDSSNGPIPLTNPP